METQMLVYNELFGVLLKDKEGPWQICICESDPGNIGSPSLEPTLHIAEGQTMASLNLVSSHVGCVGVVSSLAALWCFWQLQINPTPGIDWSWRVPGSAQPCPSSQLHCRPDAEFSTHTGQRVMLILRVATSTDTSGNGSDSRWL